MKNKLQKEYDAIVELTKSESFINGEFVKFSKQVVKKACEIMEVKRAGVWIFDEGAKSLNSIVLIDSAKYLKNVSIKTSDYPNYMQAVQAKRSIIANNALTNKDTRELAEDYLDKIGISSMLDNGIREGKKTLGVLCLEHVGQQRKWAVNEISFAGTLSDLLSQAYILGEIKETKEELITKRKELEEANIALKNILTRFEDEKNQSKENIANNIEKNIIPIISEMKSSKGHCPELIQQLEVSITNINSSFYKRLAKFNMNLSPTEVKVCQMIKSGYQGKEIAEMLGLSFATVETHKKNIRKKLDLTGKAVNLKVYLNNLEV
ncbi:MAG: GAF domain-containing protein [Deltaproteobacteria bacterium]|nr:MAG: GAF domain-containing protein [Deltaproteobacteria bacterium]